MEIFTHLKKVFKLFKSSTLSYQVGFVQGHYYLNSNQISKIKQVLNSNDCKDIVSKYEKRMASLIGPGYGISFATGRMAFYYLLKSLNVGPGDEVLLPAFTCSVMSNAVLRVGATPVFTNIDPETLGSSPSAIKEKINSNTKVIVAQHSFGIPCKIKEIMRIASPEGVFVVEDSSLTLSSTVEGIATGNFGHAAFFSTDHSKPLNTLVGGFLYTTNIELYDNLKSKISVIPDLDKPHQRRLLKQLLFEQKWYYPSRYPKSRLINMFYSLKRKLKKKHNVPTFFDDDFVNPEESQHTYPYPARLPSFLAQLGLFELERWEKEKCRRKDMLQKYLKIAGNSPISALIPEIYSDSTIDIVPLRFVYRHPKHNQHRKVMSKRVDTDWTWFRSPIIGCLKNPKDLGYHSGSCVLSEQICYDIINWPCVVPLAWNEKLLKFFNSVVKH